MPNDSFANLPKLTDIEMQSNPSVCKVDSSAPGKVTCKFASNYFNHSQEMPGGGDGYCLCSAGQYLSLKSCLQCPANTYSDYDVPNTSPNCIACASGNVSGVGSTDALQCHVDPLLQAEKETNAALKNAANTTASNLRLEQEKMIAI